MATQIGAKRKVGRPSKGDRRRFTTRVPGPVGQMVIEEAERRGVAHSDFIAEIVCAHYGFPFTADEHKGQEALDLSA